MSLFNPPFLIDYACFFSMFLLFERIRVVTLPRRLIRGHFRFFGQILEQNQAIMAQVTAKLEVRIRRKVVFGIKWPFVEISTLNSELNNPPKRILKAAEHLWEE